MLPSVVTMDQAIASGVSRRQVYRLVEKGQWLKLYPRVFLRDPTLKGDDLWKAKLAAAILFADTEALASHRSAARLHELEGVVGHPIDVTTFGEKRADGVHRSIRPDGSAVVIDRLPTTSLVRTIVDLALVCEADIVEQAVESALRGGDRRRPDIWNQALLVELRAAAAESRHNFRLRAVLARRTDTDRPTGSFPETVLLQALRLLGLIAVRQATLDILTPTGTRIDRFFPDLCLPQFRLLIEVDGAEAHANQTALDRDLKRQNKLLGFQLLRFTAIRVLNNPASVADEIARFVGTVTPVGMKWASGGASVSYSLNRFVVVDSTRVRRAG
jgi:very-short-patch-repair endonuclease